MIDTILDRWRVVGTFTWIAPLRRLAVANCMVLAMASVAAAQPPTPEDTGIDVRTDRMTISFPAPYLHVRTPKPAVTGFYVWRMSTGGDSAFSVVLVADTAMRTTDFRRIVGASTVRICPSPAVSALQCTRRIDGRARVTVDGVVVEVRDSATVARIRRARPSTYWQYVVEPGARFRVRQLPITYR
jgi:hypothetical protein